MYETLLSTITLLINENNLKDDFHLIFLAGNVITDANTRYQEFTFFSHPISHQVLRLR